MAADAACEGQRFGDLLATGNQLYRKREVEKAAETFTAALSVTPNDRNGLVCRSRCYLLMGQFENALKDAEASLKGNKKFCEGLYQKAEALYQMGELEYALVFYHRGQKLRPQMQEFRMGIQKAQDDIVYAINNEEMSLIDAFASSNPLFKKHALIQPPSNSTMSHPGSLLWGRKMPLLRSGVEKTWLFHEIEFGLHKDSRDYSVRSHSTCQSLDEAKQQLSQRGCIQLRLS